MLVLWLHLWCSAFVCSLLVCSLFFDLVVQVDFGAVSVGIPSDQIATIKNVGDTPAVFWISANTPGVKAAPEKGCILGGAYHSVAACNLPIYQRLSYTSDVLVVCV